MKVIYLTDPAFFDLDISLVRELSKVCELKVILIVTPRSMHRTALSINEMPDSCGIFPANKYPGLEKYEQWINFSIWHIANNPARSIFDYLRLSNHIKEFIRRNNPDIVHSSTQCLTSILLMPFIRRFKSTILTTHDPILHFKADALNYFVRCRYPYKCYKNLLFLSPVLVDDFVKLEKYDIDRIFISPLGVYDYLRTYPTRPNNLGKYILFFGNIEPYKGVDLLIEAFMRSRCKEEGFHLVVAGKGKISCDVQDESIKYINRFIPSEELANLIHHCEFVVLPYRSATQSGCLMSAFALNKPVLCTRAGDLPLEVEDHVTGIIVDPNSVDELVGGINGMLAMDKKIMQENIKNKYTKNGTASWEVIAQGLIRIYKKIVLKTDGLG